VKTRFRPAISRSPSRQSSSTSPVPSATEPALRTAAPVRNAKGAAWIELFGAEWSIPPSTGFVNYDPKKVSGFAFGIGIDRLAMLKYGIDDIQVFFPERCALPPAVSLSAKRTFLRSKVHVSLGVGPFRSDIRGWLLLGFSP